MFWYRALTRVSSTEQPIQGNILAILLNNLSNLALMFNWHGDEVWVTKVAQQPTLDAVSGALFVLGVVVAFYSLIRFLDMRYLYLLAAFGALLLPSALALAFPRENPSLVRTGGAIPFAAILLALPLAFCLRLSRPQEIRIAKTLRGIAVGAICLAAVFLNYRWYFVDYDLNYKQFAQNSSEVAGVMRDFIKDGGDMQHTYFIGYPFWMDGRAIAINLGDITWHNYTLDVSNFLERDSPASRFYILHPNDGANLQRLVERYPNSQTTLIKSQTSGKDFIAVFVPAQ
jgi:hypothetical protein